MSAKVGDVRLSSEYLAVDLEKLSSSCERSVDGLVGADFSRGRVVQIDFDAQKIRLLKPDKAGKLDEALPLQLCSCGIRHLFRRRHGASLGDAEDYTLAAKNLTQDLPSHCPQCGIIPVNKP